jgi:surface antigen
MRYAWSVVSLTRASNAARAREVCTMNERLWIGWATSAALFLGCGSERGDANEIGAVTEALSPCNETVPANRFIDGLPAYAQCPTTENSAIYSNNGVDTATAAMGTDWVRTQSSGGYQCTELAHRYLVYRWHVTWLPRGNAGTWCDTQPTADSGVVQTMTPVHGDLMVFAPGSCGADSVAGHVAVVDTVGGSNGKLSAVQQNVASRSSYAPTCAKCYLHVVANDGTPGAVGAGGSAGAGMGGAGTGGGVSTGGVPAVGAGGAVSAGGVPGVGAGGVQNPPSGAGGLMTTPMVGSGGLAGAPVTGASGGYAAVVPPVGAGAPSYAGAAGAPAITSAAPATDSSSSGCAVVRGPASAPRGYVLGLLSGLVLVLRRRSERMWVRVSR